MIPLKLELKNFMAYREGDPLDLSGLHVVVLTGDNGAGKSTLLDAITWALWGQARAKRDDELISQGTTEMRVALVFSEGKDVYQVVRSRKVGKAVKGKAPASTGSLDFFIKDANNGWTLLSEPKASETQAKIERTLNLSYDTFINSAYLKQGRADEFTLKPPAQRKELLSEILSLDLWQDYEAKAKERQAFIEREQAKIEVDLAHAESEIAKLPQAERDLADAQQALAAIQGMMAEAEAAMTEIERQREALKALRAQSTQSEQRLRGMQAELAEVEQDRTQHQAALAQYQAALNQHDEIEHGFATLVQARTDNEALNLKLTSMADLNARKFAAENALADARRKIESDVEARHMRVRELERLSTEDGLPLKLAEVREQLDALELIRQKRDAAQHDLSEARERQGEVRAQNELLRREMAELKANIDALSKIGAMCPTCRRELAEEDRVRLLADWQRQGRERGDLYRANENLTKQLAEQRAGIEQRIADADHALVNVPGLQREHAALAERLTKAQEAETALPEAQQELAAVQARLDKVDYAPDAHAALGVVVKELAALGYDAVAHARLRELLQQLSHFVERKAQLDRAAVQVEREQLALQALDVREQAVAQRRVVEEKTMADLRADMGTREQALLREPEVAAALNRTRTAYFDANRKLISAQQLVQSCIAMQSTRHRLSEELAQLTHQQSLADALRQAFGKNGVPAMLIEAVLPELEASANELLGRMTNGRMNVRFETQRLTQKGDTSETLEIRISDDVGERAYEMFSGGEAFRINFAIRIALSKLLAHRASAKLQTLFVDEGFGTQDASGRERLIEAIKAIERDFERIVVITHIDELKDAFPARIEVTKTTRGSTARIV